MIILSRTGLAARITWRIMFDLSLYLYLYLYLRLYLNLYLHLYLQTCLLFLYLYFFLQEEDWAGSLNHLLDCTGGDGGHVDDQ